MENTRSRVKLVVTAACCILISVLARAQEKQGSEPPTPPTGYVLMFERTGGYAGVQEKIWVYPDGRAINDAGKTAKISPDVINKWLEKISTFPALSAPDSFPADSYCMDCFIYQLTTYRKDGTKRLIRWNSAKRESGGKEKGLGQMRDQLLQLKWN
jgi:hypothetical protein